MPTAADRAIRIVTSFQLSEEDEELGEELFDVVDEMVQNILLSSTPEELERAQMQIANTMIVMAALVDGLMDECPKDVVLAEIAELLTGSLP